jgi:hypothetical protein
MKTSMETAPSMPKNKLGRPVWRVLLAVQGAYFAILGAWPIFDIRSFQAVSGPKTDHLVTGNEDDHWLVITVGALITVIGLTFVVASWRKRLSLEVGFLAIGSASALATVDIVYVSRKVIDPIYLVDAGVELVFVLGWIAVGFRHRHFTSKRDIS